MQKSRHDGLRELRVHLTSDFQRGFAFAAKGRECIVEIVQAVRPHDARDVEHVTWLHRGAAVVDLLCDDFRRSFEQNISAADGRFHRRVVGQAWSADEIDLADILEDDVQRPRSVGLVAVRIDVERVALGPRVQIWQKLRIVEKDVDVKAFAVIDLKHQGRAAPKGPAVD